MESKLAKAGAEEQWKQDFSASWPLGMFAPACSEHLIVFLKLLRSHPLELSSFLVKIHTG